MALEEGRLRPHEGIPLALSGLLRVVLGLMKGATEACMQFEPLCYHYLCSSPGEPGARSEVCIWPESQRVSARCWRKEESEEAEGEE
jgi:hypothetical protein